uniref:DUF19 domain-containing protein n=1 Tax=Strigamia maritima TaxID=126957 RepID=T1IJN2_STRMM
MSMLYKLTLLYVYTFSTISLTTGSVCDVSTTDLDDSYHTCVNLIDDYNSCWEVPSNIICRGTSTSRGVRTCLNKLQNKPNKCQVEQIAAYLTRLGSMMRSTDDILCSLTSDRAGFNQKCWELARQTTLLQGKFMMDGFDSEEGCGYRTIYSLINEYYSDNYEQCHLNLNSFRYKWYELMPCASYQNTSQLYLSRTGNQIKPMCLQIQSDVDECFRELLNCDKEQLESWQCFNDVLRRIHTCNDSILEINIKHRAETMKSALEFLCRINCPELIRRDCFSHFKKLTLYSAAAAKDFHSTEFCEFRKQYMDIIALTSPLKCHKLMEEYSNYMFDVATCVNISETIKHHQLHDYNFEAIDNSAKPLPMLALISGLLVIPQISFALL